MADNASITILRNTQANINAEPIKDGNILFTTDQAENRIYADVGTRRIKIGGTVDVDTELSTTSTNPVQNKVITNNINDVRGQIRTNLLNPTAQTQTIKGVTLTNNGDGTYTVNGTANGKCAFRVGNMTIKKDSYAKITGCPKNGSGDTYYLAGTNNVDYDLGSDIGSGHIFHNTSNYTEFYIYIIISSGTTVNNLLFKPMITTDLSATYDDFVPYTGDSGRLNEDVANLFDVIRPVGSLYSTTDANFNPNTAKGWHGTWERIKDCVIYASGDSDTVGEIVGSNTHTLSSSELPAHKHPIPKLTGKAKSHGIGGLFAALSGTNFGVGFWNNGHSLSNYWPFSGGEADSRHEHDVETNESNTSNNATYNTPIDMRSRRLNSIVWRRTA